MRKLYLSILFAFGVVTASVASASTFPTDAISIHKHVIGNSVSDLLVVPPGETYTILYVEQQRTCTSPHDKLYTDSMMIFHATDAGTEYTAFMQMPVTGETIRFSAAGTNCGASDHHFVVFTYVPYDISIRQDESDTMLSIDENLNLFFLFVQSVMVLTVVWIAYKSFMRVLP